MHPYLQEKPKNFEEFTLCLGRKISMLRRDRGLSQKDLARLAGISPSYLAKIECATGSQGLSLQVLYILAKTLDQDVSALLSFGAPDTSRVKAYKQKIQRTKALAARVPKDTPMPRPMVPPTVQRPMYPMGH